MQSPFITYDFNKPAGYKPAGFFCDFDARFQQTLHLTGPKHRAGSQALSGSILAVIDLEWAMLDQAGFLGQWMSVADGRLAAPVRMQLIVRSHVDG